LFFFFLEINPYDYAYSALNCRLESLEATCEEAQIISKYIYRQGDIDRSKNKN